MSEFEIIDRREVGRDAWDAFVDDSAEAWLWHRFDLCEGFGQWHASEDASFALAHEGNLAAVMPLRRIAYRRFRAITVCDVESTGGTATADRLGRRLAVRARQRAIAEALERAGRRAGQLRVLLPPLAPSLRGRDAPRVNPLLELGLENAVGQTWLLDLSVGPEELWEGLEGRARTAIRKAEKESLSVRLAQPTPDDLDTYVALHSATCARTGVRPHPRAYFETIWSRFLEPGLSRILFAEREGEVLAARNTAVYKGAASTWTAAGATEGNQAGANVLLEWESIRRLPGEGVEWFDSGEAFPGVADPKLQAISKFKQSMGGELWPLYRARLDLRGRVVRILDALRS